MKDSSSDTISLHIYNNSPYKITLPLGLLGFCETNATLSPTKETSYRVNSILQLLDIRQSTILDEELSIIKILGNEKRNTDYFTKTPPFAHQNFEFANIQKNSRSFLKCLFFNVLKNTRRIRATS